MTDGHPDHPGLPVDEEPLTLSREELQVVWDACEGLHDNANPNPVLNSVLDKLEWMDTHFKERGL